ncbi:YlxR family protein [Rhodococcoides kroppenstedtii]|uniref:YlxR family protein n=1 Tax=Rhodococcoides kroppenstedtii TaxID=293050 RepID=UPI0035301F4A
MAHRHPKRRGGGQHPVTGGDDGPAPGGVDGPAPGGVDGPAPGGGNTGGNTDPESALDCDTARRTVDSAASGAGTPVPQGPVRTCVGCKRRDSPSALVRIAVVLGEDGGARAVVDHRRRLPGRGAWLHPDPDCFQQAEKRRALGRALRVTGPLDRSAVVCDRTTIDRPTGRGNSPRHEENRFTNS